MALNLKNPGDLAWTVDDLALAPRTGKLRSRSDAKLHPFIYSAPMDTVTSHNLASALIDEDHIPVISRFLKKQERQECLYSLSRQGVFFAIGLDDPFLADIERNAPRAITTNVALDIAHGDSTHAYEYIKKLRAMPFIGNIMSGSICTPDAAVKNIQAGATHLRIGVGPSPVCSTRIMTGFGIPQGSAVYNIHEALANVLINMRGVSRDKSRRDITLIADGGISQPGQVCVTGDTLILKTDLTWCRADLINSGDELIAFDEDKKLVTEKHHRYYRKAKVEANTKQLLECIEIQTTKGNVKVSKDHLWLCKSRSANEFVWRKTQDLKIQDIIIYFGSPWQTLETYEAGWIAGFLDGEGCISVSDNKNRGGRNYSLTCNQVKGVTSEHAFKLLRTIVPTTHSISARSKYYTNAQDQDTYKISFLYDQLKLLGTTRPVRLLPKSDTLWEGRQLENTDKAIITNLTDIGIQETYSVSTSTNTFIANGFLSHNCKYLAMGADAVMLGSVFAPTRESAGWVEDEDSLNRKILSKQYRGQASAQFQEEILGHSSACPEGVALPEMTWDGKTTVHSVVNFFEQGVRSGISYAGLTSSLEFRDAVIDAYLVSPAAQREAYPHGLLNRGAL